MVCQPGNSIGAGLDLRSRRSSRPARILTVSVAGSERSRRAGGRATRRDHVQQRETAKASHSHQALRVHVRLATCYNLLMREARNRVGDRWNLTLPQFDVLAELARAE